tara:strand:- start:225 stop:731 length:507 start_codon:yes stop_codon:yes gene_type:complete
MDYSNIDMDEITYQKFFDFNDNDDIFFGRNPVNRDNLNNRPQLHTSDEYVLNKSEIDEVLLNEDKKKKEIKSNNKKPETIMDINLGTIFSNISNLVINFWSDYKEMLVEVKYNMDEQSLDEKDKNISYLLKIHIQSLIKYLNKNNNTIYIGIIFIILSILLYFINIIR